MPGIHLEGPYFSPAQAGAQDPNFIKNPNPDEYMPILNSTDKLLRWSAACESEGAFELAEACRKTLAMRGDDGTGWSLAWKCNFFARLWDGDHALLLLKNQLRPCGVKDTVYTGGGGSYPNLMCAHPPFQIDGNFGATSGVAEMLLQSDVDTVHIIPALPSEWSEVTVSGLCAKGKRKVSFKVEGDKLTECRIQGPAPKRIFVAGVDMTEMMLPSANGVAFGK